MLLSQWSSVTTYSGRDAGDARRFEVTGDVSSFDCTVSHVHSRRRGGARAGARPSMEARRNLRIRRDPLGPFRVLRVAQRRA